MTAIAAFESLLHQAGSRRWVSPVEPRPESSCATPKAGWGRHRPTILCVGFWHRIQRIHNSPDLPMSAHVDISDTTKPAQPQVEPARHPACAGMKSSLAVEPSPCQRCAHSDHASSTRLARPCQTPSRTGASSTPDRTPAWTLVSRYRRDGLCVVSSCRPER